ncbi:hypothetical protein HMPREF0649_01650 [Segatella buccae D17]|nr:hypothetical protein HMPREF0649_01650 [Segatella buccae D17]
MQRPCTKHGAANRQTHKRTIGKQNGSWQQLQSQAEAPPWAGSAITALCRHSTTNGPGMKKKRWQ